MERLEYKTERLPTRKRCAILTVRTILLPLHIFIDLPLERQSAHCHRTPFFFLQVYVASLIPKRTDDQGNNTYETRMKISVLTDISVLGFYGYIRDISIFITYSKFKDIFNLYIKISLQSFFLI